MKHDDPKGFKYRASRERTERESEDTSRPPPKPLRYPLPGEGQPREFTAEEIAAAATWLRHVLSDGSVESVTLFQLAEEAGIYRSLLQLAKRKLGVVHHDANAQLRLPNARKLWLWSLPQRRDTLFDQEPWDDDERR